MKFISWKVSQAVLDISNIFPSQKDSDKVLKKIDRSLITGKQFKDEEEKSCWNKNPEVLMVKKPGDWTTVVHT